MDLLYTPGTTTRIILQLATAVLVILLCTSLVLWAKFKKHGKTELPVMEAGRAKGKMALGNKDYEPK
jgi:cytochrome c-type biogenesis protein CcmH/NrfG